MTDKMKEMYVRFVFPEDTVPEFKFAMSNVKAHDVTNVVQPLLNGKSFKKIGSITANKDGSAGFKFEEDLSLEFERPVDFFVVTEESKSAEIILLQ